MADDLQSAIKALKERAIDDEDFELAASMRQIEIFFFEERAVDPFFGGGPHQ